MSRSQPLVITWSRQGLCAVALAIGCAGAHATPELYSDKVARFLAEKGLLNTDAQGDAAAPASDAASKPPVESDFMRSVRDGASEMVYTAMNFLGVPYRRGGTTAEKGFDCSGFTRHIFQMSLGLVLPRRADEQASAPGFVSIGREELKPGDLVFFNTLRRTFSHVGIYVGEGKFIHSPRPGGEVRVDDMGIAYWAKRFTGARRAETALRDVGSPGRSAEVPNLAGTPGLPPALALPQNAPLR